MEDIIFTTQAVIAEGVNPGKLTQEEEAILILTEEIWNRFLELPINHSMIRDDNHKRILRCSEGNRVWYRLWINPEDMMRIEPLLEGGDRIWMEELEMYYTFFYEIRNGRRVLGKDRIKEILDTLL